MSERSQDPWGILCTVVLYSTTLTVTFAVNYLPPAPRVALVLYNGLVALFLACHLRCMWTNPGVAKEFLVQETQEQMRAEWQRLLAAGCTREEAALCQDVKVWGAPPRRWWCVTCDSFKPKRSHHCRTCRCCVLEMDHHCPWVNNCVGGRNHKYFILFVGYAWLACWSSVALLAWALNDMGEPWETWEAQRFGSRWHAQLLCLACAAASFVFAIFASVMGCDQWTFVAEGHGAVDQKLRQVREGAAPRSGQLSQVLGEGLWSLLPVAGPLPFSEDVDWHRTT